MEGSRILENKKEFNIIDLGNNAARFGLWGSPLDWQKIFMSPHYYLENLISDEDIEKQFVYVMPDDVREKFAKSTDIHFDIKAAYNKAIRKGQKSKVVLDDSIEQHRRMCVENSEDVFDARI